MSSSVITVRRLELRVRRGTLPWDESRSYDTVDLVLDGRNLGSWLAQHAPPGTDPQHYLGHPVGTDMTALLLGQQREEEFGERTALLGCTCTDIGCGALVARIDVGPDTVTWSEVSRARGPHVDYHGLELRFDRDAYLRALEDFEAAVTRGR